MAYTSFENFRILRYRFRRTKGRSKVYKHLFLERLSLKSNKISWSDPEKWQGLFLRNHRIMAEKSEQLTITNLYEEQLVGNLHRAKKRDLIIVCHGFGCNKDSGLIVDLCEAFQKQDG